MDINAQQHEELLRRLRSDYDFEDGEEYLTKGKCPECGKRELFVSKAKPWQLCCNRRNKCGFTASTFDLYKHTLFADWSTHYPATLHNPNATADAYMAHARGFDLQKVRGLYNQEYYAPAPGQGTATVRFSLSDGKAQWERIIDYTDRFSGQKGRALGSYKGLWWQLPDADFDVETVWITEGIFDALSLIHAGHTAIASISCSHYPNGFFAMLRNRSLNPCIIFAMDNDTAGQEAIRKHVEKARADGFNAKAALPPSRADWNDLWCRGQLDGKAIEEARYRGDLLVAGSAAEAARIMYRRTGMTAFHLCHSDKTYWFALNTQAYQAAVEVLESNGQWHDDDASRDEALKQSMSMTEIANFTFTPLYFQRDRYNVKESTYFLRVTMPNGFETHDVFSGPQLGSATDFKKRVLSVSPGAIYEGNTSQLNRIIKSDFMGMKIVDTVDYTGYVKELDAWIFRDFAVSNGKIIRVNKDKFIALDGRHSIKTTSDIEIHLSDDSPKFEQWLPNFWTVFAERGMVALAFFTGTLFVEQVRQVQRSWPFLEITGDGGTGKTTLIEFLWRLLGRDGYEGFDPANSTLPGRARTFNKVSGLPLVLIESDHDDFSPSHQKKFSYSELKDLYNGRPYYTRGALTGGLETHDPPFRGSIVLAQNHRVEAEEAVLSRILTLNFLRANMTKGGKPYADALNRLTVEDLATYLVHILRNSKKILKDYFDIYPLYEQRLLNNSEISMSRIAQNGAQIMAFMHAISHQIKIDENILNITNNYIENICIDRQKSLAIDHPMIIEFWDSVEYLNAMNTNFNVDHSSDEGLIAINLPHAESSARLAGIQFPPRTELNRLLAKSRRYEFLGRRSVRSKLLGKVIKCLVFRKK